MVISNLKGGLGNYLFQIAAGYSLSLDNNVNFAIDSTKIMKVHTHWSVYEPNILRNVPVVQNLANYNYYLYESLTYRPIPYVSNMLIDGYFQSEKYWKKNENKILELFKIDENTLEYLKYKYEDIINSDNTCSIHVRRGDFLRIDFYNKLDMNNYYNKAIETIGLDKQFVVFSDDIEWCKENFKHINATFIKEKLDFLDLYLISLCKNNITSNSTFSWWASYLNTNTNTNTKIITPNTWFLHTHSNEDIVPENWIKI